MSLTDKEVSDAGTEVADMIQNKLKSYIESNQDKAKVAKDIIGFKNNKDSIKNYIKCCEKQFPKSKSYVVLRAIANSANATRNDVQHYIQVILGQLKSNCNLNETFNISDNIIVNDLVTESFNKAIDIIFLKTQQGSGNTANNNDGKSDQSDLVSNIVECAFKIAVFVIFSPIIIILKVADWAEKNQLLGGGGYKKTKERVLIGKVKRIVYILNKKKYLKKNGSYILLSKIKNWKTI